MSQAILERAAVMSQAHPNDFDCKRIERAITTRKRYRYVSPRVEAVMDGYRIESPCCSRNVDPEGGMVDVALLKYDQERARWHLFRKDHASGTWEFDSGYDRLIELLESLNADPDRKFWQ